MQASTFLRIHLSYASIPSQTIKARGWTLYGDFAGGKVWQNRDLNPWPSNLVVLQQNCNFQKFKLFLTRQNSSSTATGFLTTAFDPSSRRPSRRGSSTFSTPSWRCGPASDASIRNSSRPSRTKSLPSWRSTRTSSARARAGERTPAASGRSVATCWQTPASATLASTAPTWGTSPSTARSSLHRVNLPDLSLVQKLRVFE